jgi:hypothetical protein
MKDSNAIEDAGPLRELLAAWRVEAVLPPRFQARVWRRIEQRAVRPEFGGWTELFNALGAALARPRLAVSYVILLLAAGLLAGYWQGRLAQTRAEETLGARYVQMLDPYQMPPH